MLSHSQKRKRQKAERAKRDRRYHERKVRALLNDPEFVTAAASEFADTIAHEAGHAIVYRAQGFPIEYARAGVFSGAVRRGPSPDEDGADDLALIRLLTGVVAGNLAASMLNPTPSEPLLSDQIRAGDTSDDQDEEHMSDLQHALELVDDLFEGCEMTDGEIADFVAAAEGDARAIIMANFDAWLRLCEALDRARGRRLSGGEIDAVVGALVLPPERVPDDPKCEAKAEAEAA